MSAVGERFPLHTTASGKACLALLNEAEICRLVGDSLASVDGGQSLEGFLAEIAEVRRTGLADDDEEHSLGISAVGAALRDPAGDIYAISIPAPTARARSGRERNAELLLKARDEIAGIVGSREVTGALRSA